MVEQAFLSIVHLMATVYEFIDQNNRAYHNSIFVVMYWNNFKYDQG